MAEEKIDLEPRDRLPRTHWLKNVEMLKFDEECCIEPVTKRIILESISNTIAAGLKKLEGLAKVQPDSAAQGTYTLAVLGEIYDAINDARVCKEGEQITVSGMAINPTGPKGMSDLLENIARKAEKKSQEAAEKKKEQKVTPPAADLMATEIKPEPVAFVAPVIAPAPPEIKIKTEPKTEPKSEPEMKPGKEQFQTGEKVIDPKGRIWVVDDASDPSVLAVHREPTTDRPKFTAGEVKIGSATVTKAPTTALVNAQPALTGEIVRPIKPVPVVRKTLVFPVGRTEAIRDWKPGEVRTNNKDQSKFKVLSVTSDGVYLVRIETGPDAGKEKLTGNKVGSPFITPASPEIKKSPPAATPATPIEMTAPIVPIIVPPPKIVVSDPMAAMLAQAAAMVAAPVETEGEEEKKGRGAPKPVRRTLLEYEGKVWEFPDVKSAAAAVNLNYHKTSAIQAFNRPSTNIRDFKSIGEVFQITEDVPGPNDSAPPLRIKLKWGIDPIKLKKTGIIWPPYSAPPPTTPPPKAAVPLHLQGVQAFTTIPGRGKIEYRESEGKILAWLNEKGEWIPGPYPAAPVILENLRPYDITLQIRRGGSDWHDMATKDVKEAKNFVRFGDPAVPDAEFRILYSLGGGEQKVWEDPEAPKSEPEPSEPTGQSIIDAAYQMLAQRGEI